MRIALTLCLTAAALLAGCSYIAPGDAYVIRQYLEPKRVIDDAIDKICT